jgi:UDP-N-acetylglucosamine 3-dehydrogenase
MGRQHARVLGKLETAALVGICDCSGEARVRAETHGVEVVERWEDVLRLRPDAVVNALPTRLHFEVTSALLDEGLHVLVEKPIATAAVEARAMIDLARRRGVVLMVGHTERFNPVVLALREHLASGHLGRIVSMSARRVGVGRPAVPSVGVAVDLAIHDLDVFSYLVGGATGELVFAAGAALHENLVEDHVDVVARYGDTLATLQANWITPVKVRRLNVTGTKGVAEVDYLLQSLQVFDSAPALIQASPANFFAVSRESEPVQVPIRAREPLVCELEEFVSAIREGRDPVVPATDAAKALELAIEATEEMHRTSHVLGPAEMGFDPDSDTASTPQPTDELR